ncbi:MAG: hypothetical protein QM528_00245 [Phycisphaerales bacterium]|nr:hypothetical protein [Phycisphaerales bacterium]
MLKNVLKYCNFFCPCILLSLTLFGCGVFRQSQTPQRDFTNNDWVWKSPEDNFRTIGRVGGSSSATYVLGIGGLSHKTLIERAIDSMYAHANFNEQEDGTTIINQTREYRYAGFFPFYFNLTVTVRGTLVQVKKPNNR